MTTDTPTLDALLVPDRLLVPIVFSSRSSSRVPHDLMKKNRASYSGTRLALYYAAAPLWLVGVIAAVVPAVNDLFSIVGVGAAFWLCSLGGLIHVAGVGGGKLAVRRPRPKSYSRFMKQRLLEATAKRGESSR